MSLSYLSKVFAAIKEPSSISIQLLRIIENKDGVHYITRQIEVQPIEELSRYTEAICSKCIEDLSSAGSIDDYAGDFVKGAIYKVSLEDELIAARHQSLAAAVVDPNTECKIDEQKWNALLIKATVTFDDKEHDVLFVSMRSPISVLTNRFLFSGKDKFKQVKEPVLTLNKTLDAVIADHTFYMLTMQAENLFAMERSYKLRCSKKVEEIAELGILSDVEAFEVVATNGMNPRRFVSFNQSRLEVLKDKTSRKRHMKKFMIAIGDDGIIDTTDSKVSERLVKFLCDKAMLDPIDEEPREVSAAKAWS